MARFQFSMQSLLNIKGQLENQKKIEYAIAQEALKKSEERLDELLSQKQQLFDQGRTLRQSVLDFLAIKENDAALQAIEVGIRKQEERIEAAKEDVEDARLALQDAVQERKTLEKLREKAFANFLEEEKDRESKEVGELVSYTYGQRIREKADGGVDGY